MKNNDPLSPELFDKLLDWLDKDRDRAGEILLDIRLKLTIIFTQKRCLNPDELTDAVIDRVCRKLPEIIDTWVGDPILYFKKVAKYIYLEYLDDLKKKVRQEEPLDTTNPPPHVVNENPDDSDEQNQRQLCLENCLNALDVQRKDYILNYYRGERRSKITNRQARASELGLSLSAARVRAHRIKRELRSCIISCLRRLQPGM